ncbi:hypothetical protein QAD02_010341 [Eretmocerus hayati]|uniref:Uncharacterized protein n=1 Tax=Eretmocerus hayati TaxID=131215 RepID=A0ACC2NC57_9HYME|nr:hypothetical protein QAD02_010341 [Eretmocerus hayati]
MTDVSKVLKKLKKPTLPSGWIEKISKKHPDRPFYFNQNTGEQRWSPPLDSPEKDDTKPQSKGKKRKNLDLEHEKTAANSTPQNQLLSALRPKLRAKSQVNGASAPSRLCNDTPQMRLMREKKAQRTECLNAKKSTVKSLTPRTSQSSTNIPVPHNKTSMPVKTLNAKSRNGRSKSESSDSYSSVCSDVSASSMGNHIRAAAVSVQNSHDTGNAPTQLHANSLPRIPRKSTATSVASPSKVASLMNQECPGSQSESIKKTTDLMSPSDHARVLVKNTANQRLKNLRKSLKSDEEDTIPTKRRKESASTSNNNNIESTFDEKDRVHNNGRLMIQKNFLEEEGDQNQAQKPRLLDKLEIQQEAYYEEMDWEPIEDEKLTNEVHSVRYQLCERSTHNGDDLCDFKGNILQNETMSNDEGSGQNSPYIVVDTNVLLSNLPFIEEIRDSHSDICEKPFIVIPWTVLQELDFIKDDKSGTRSQSVQLKARKAVDYLNKHFGSKDPRFLGQTPQDVKRNKERFEVECPDDEILQTCLQIKESSKIPVLLSYDKNLCTKAMVHDVPILGRDDPLDKVFRLKSVSSADFLSNSLHAHIEEENQNNVNSIHKELLAADDMMEEAKAILKSVLSEIVSKEMENLFGSRWEMHVIIRPPWTVKTVLKCAIKHWMAAVSEAFARKAEPMLRDLQVCINSTPDEGRRLQDVKGFLDKCSDIAQLLKDIKYPKLKERAIDQLNVLQRNCSDKITEFSCLRFKDTVGVPSNAEEEERRASLAFKVFEGIYAFSRDICGIASAALGLQCAFSYSQMHPSITPTVALAQHQDVGASVNRLLQHMRIAMLKMVEGIRPDDKVITNLHEALIYFSSDLSFEELSKVIPLDVFCCLKLKRPKLEKGYDQLYEISIHLCRLANQQCK